ncbi:hypothetical protein LWI29_002289 [Acer saccharum]|uniref:Uncharacterized protein n=1 Tax=Acer saccharum TaxID=4024 RepID=A0AA39S0F9_ACESA|nr:hypothetical protein LWI29_002289 [Acer saccharum]KAK1561214.1 hypothetical protein Q3G72_035606 [Acer saccharum]
MRCKKHPTDLSSSVGVCASCLRERLFALIAAQVQAQQQAAAHLSQSHSRAAILDDRRKQEPPPPLVFPRSVSPYVARRKSDDAAAANWSSHHSRFYSTPQVGPSYNSYYSAATASATTTTGNFASKKKTSKFSIFSNLFRTRSDKLNSDRKNSDHGDPYRDSCETSSSFFSTIFSTRRKKQSTVTYVENPMACDRKDTRISNRGMSPERGTDTEEDCDRSPWGSGGSSEECRKTPMSTAPVAVKKTRNGHHHHSRNVSGLTFCLSPLVRASPNRHWNQKGGLPPDMAFSGEIRGPAANPHLATAASFCANRSRKLADFGRVNHNR